ncbi:hypothetical protein Tco_1077767 [Tanacetum coccineum]
MSWSRKRDCFWSIRKEPLSRSSKFNIQVQGSCNGVMCILQDDGYAITSLAVVHPLRKECYELPPFPLRFDMLMRRVFYSDIKTGDCGRDVIWFDVNKGEFGLIERPKRMCGKWRCYSCTLDELVDLNGEVGCVEFWLLNHKKE